MRCLLPILAAISCVSSFGCTAAKEPGSGARVATIVNTLPSASASAAVAPKAPPEPAKASTEDDDSKAGEVDKGPALDCSKFSKGTAPDRRWLCELVMKDRPSASALDARGFAAVGYYERPGEGEESGLIQTKELACGAKAEKRFAEIARTLRYKLSMSLDDPEQVVCKGLECTLSGQGEYATWDTLTFRQGTNGLVLASWTSIETTLIAPDAVEERYKWVAKGLRELKGKRCP